MTVLFALGMAVIGALVAAILIGTTCGGWLSREALAVVTAANRNDADRQQLIEDREQLDAERRELAEWRRRIDEVTRRRITPSDLDPVQNGRHSMETAYGSAGQIGLDSDTGVIDRAAFVAAGGAR